MEKRFFQETGEKVSLLGFGCMRLPRLQEERPEIDEAKAEEMIDCAYRNGVNYFDTAYPYHNGLSELFVGKALEKYPRESFYLADKMPSWLLNNREDGKRIFREQLKKCRVNYFDFYLCHSLSSAQDDYISRYEKTCVIDDLNGRKESGEIRHLGFSFHGTPAELVKILDRRDWDFVQIQLNYLDWDVQDAKAKYRILEERGIPVIIMEPVRGGSLAALCEDSVRLLHQARPDRSAASWAIRFAASLPGVLTVLSGMSTLDQVKDNLATMAQFQPLTEAERKVLQQSLQIYLRTGSIPCTGCRYCMDCPAGVDIPKVFSVYNECAASMRLPVSAGVQHAFDKNAGAFIKAYEVLPEKQRAEHCVTCGACMKKCPQKIRIPERMKEISLLVRNIEEE